MKFIILNLDLKNGQKKQERAWFKAESGERHIKLTRIYYKEKSQEMNTLEKKIQFGRKISVFISSKCGDEKYDNIRQRLKSLIEKTGFADVYLFENSPASSLSAQKEYIYELDDSDVCIFLIDNADGVKS